MSFFGGVCFNALGCVWIFGWWVDLQHEEVEMMTRLKKIYEALMGVQSSEFRPHILQLTPTKNKNKHADPSKKKECTSRSYIYILYKSPPHQGLLSWLLVHPIAFSSVLPFWILLSCVFFSHLESKAMGRPLTLNFNCERLAKADKKNMGEEGARYTHHLFVACLCYRGSCFLDLNI